MALNTIIYYYHVLKRILKAILKKHIGTTRKKAASRKKTHSHFLLSANLTRPGLLQKPSQKLKTNQIVGNIFAGKVYTISVWLGFKDF